MYILSLDTSNGYSQVGVSYNSNIIYAKKTCSKNMQAENLIPMIEEALIELKLEYAQINYVAASCGPGSFTGIRIALAAARGIAIASPTIKTICVNNFQTIYCRISEQVKYFDYSATIVNAYKDQLYLQIFDKVKEIGEPILMFINEARNYIESLEGKIVISGSGIEKLYEFSNHLTPSKITILPRFPYPDIRFISKIAYKNIISGQINESLDPLYIRPPDAKLPQ